MADIKDVNSIQNQLSTFTGKVDSNSVVSNVLAKVNDPIGGAISATISSINSLTANLQSKVDSLESNLFSSSDNTGKVKLSGNTVIVTLESEDPLKIASFESKITKDIQNINNSINKLNILVESLTVISYAAEVLKVAMNAKEVALTIGNPVAKATMILLKKALQILFYKDVLNEYTNIITTQLAQNRGLLNQLNEKFSKLSVQFVQSSYKNKGTVLSEYQAASILSDSKLSSSVSANITPQDYVSSSGASFTLSVEKYGNNNELIGRARDKYSGMMVAETSPSFISTPEQLLNELKSILDT